jgi:hypothetical protein
VNGHDNLNGSKAIKAQSAESGEEGFLDIFKAVAKVGPKIIPFTSPLLGPVGGILGPVVGGLLGSLAESGFSDNQNIRTDGTTERAILAEAALQAVLASEHTEGLTEVVGKMERIWRANAPKVDFLAPMVTPIIAQCSSELLGQRQLIQKPSLQRYHHEQSRRSLGVELPESFLGGEEAAFIQGLMGPTRQVAGEESMFDWLGPVLETAVTVAKPIASQVTSAALVGLDGVTKGALGPESTISDPSNSNQHQEATRILLERAVMADIALQALMALPSHKMEQLKPVNPETRDAEGIFDYIKDTVQKLGPLALDAAKTYLPRLIDSVSQEVPSKLGFKTETSGSARPMLKKPSLLETLEDENAATKVSHVRNMAADTARIDVTHLIRARQRLWAPSDEWQKCWDDNDDGPVMMNQPPPDF